MTTSRPRQLGLVFLLLAFVWPQGVRAQAGIELAPVFGDHMVLQRGVPIPVWGTAESGSEILVGMGTRSVLTVADAEGRWSVVLPPRAASKESTQFLVASGAESITVRDVLVGEVWLCSGQSNMRWPLASAASAAEELPAADHPRIRLLNQPGAAHPANRAFTDEELARCNPQEFYGGAWTRCGPSTAEGFSAVAYFFGRRLHAELDVPIGLIHDAVGGSPTQAWIRREALEADPRLRPFVEQGPDCELAQPWCRERAARNLERWHAAERHAREQGESPPPRPGHPFDPSFLWEAGIAPLAPFALRGVIWYQGESNADDPNLHDVLFPTLIRDWRRAWGADFPFLFVQLSALGTREGWPEFRDGQRRALSLPNTGMAVTIDVGHRTDVHPRDKRTVGNRLARWALATTYERDVVPSGPLLLLGTRRKDRVVLEFRHVAGGLEARGGDELRGFTIAGVDRVFHPAEARIVAATVEVWSDAVDDPTFVRYAWAPYPDGNLDNAEGLPASPFETAVETSLVVVAFGDSSTATRGTIDEVYAQRLGGLLAAAGIPARVVNAGVGGNTIAHARERFARDVLAREPDVVVLQFGLNDSAIDVHQGKSDPRVPQGDYEANLEFLLETLEARGIQAVVMTPNPMLWTERLRQRWGKPPYDVTDRWGFNLLNRSYAEAVRRIATHHEVPLVDVYRRFEEFDAAPDRSTEELLLDGMHPDDQGHELIARALADRIIALERVGRFAHRR